MNQVYPSNSMSILIAHLRGQNNDHADVASACHDIIGHGIYLRYTKKISPGVLANIIESGSHLQGTTAAMSIEQAVRVSAFPLWIIALAFTILKFLLTHHK